MLVLLNLFALFTTVSSTHQICYHVPEGVWSQVYCGHESEYSHAHLTVSTDPVSNDVGDLTLEKFMNDDVPINEALLVLLMDPAQRVSVADLRIFSNPVASGSNPTPIAAPATDSDSDSGSDSDSTWEAEVFSTSGCDCACSLACCMDSSGEGCCTNEACPSCVCNLVSVHNYGADQKHLRVQNGGSCHLTIVTSNCQGDTCSYTKSHAPCQ